MGPFLVFVENPLYLTKCRVRPTIDALFLGRRFVSNSRHEFYTREVGDMTYIQ